MKNRLFITSPFEQASVPVKLPKNRKVVDIFYNDIMEEWRAELHLPYDYDAITIKCPYKVGQEVWGAEPWKVLRSLPTAYRVFYKDSSYKVISTSKDCSPQKYIRPRDLGGWRLHQHMPKEFSRWSGTVTSIDVDKKMWIIKAKGK